MPVLRRRGPIINFENKADYSLFTNVIYFINLCFVNIFFIVNTPDSIFRDMRYLNKLDLI